ncbi:hypothetical protein ACOSP7_001917 [Xanthoceras sorbifolium]
MSRTGFRHVQVDVDCLEVVNLIQKSCNRNHPLWYLVQECRFWTAKEWLCEITHAVRKSNQVADFMAGLGHKCNGSVVYFEEPPPLVSAILARDAAGFLFAINVTVR